MRIVDLAMEDIRKRLEDRNMSVYLTETAKKHIASAAYSPTFGARPVKRYLQKHIETEIAAKIIRGEVKDGETITIDMKEDRMVI